LEEAADAEIRDHRIGGYERTAPEVRNAAHAHDDELKRNRVLLGVAGPPVQVRNPEAAGVKTKDGAFMSSALPIAGFAVIEAADLAEAIALVAKSSCALAHGVVEIWPLQGSWRSSSTSRQCFG
jgi:hypothetical protein